MKSTTKPSIFILMILALTATAYAQTQAEQLKQMVAQLEANRDDNALREKIIKFAAAMRPAPAIPEEADRRMARGRAAYKDAKSVSDFEDAANEFLEAIRVAPWYGDAYFNNGLARDKAGDYDRALNNLKFALLSFPDDKKIKDLIYEVEYRAEKAAAAKTEADKQAVAKKAEDDRIARAEDENRRTEQAKRDVITQIKNVVKNRTYDWKILSYRNKGENVWDGVNQYELFGGGTYYMFDAGANLYWKFFDDRVELINTYKGDHVAMIGESWGPKISDMRWFPVVLGERGGRVWGYFDLQNGYLYYSGGFNSRPINDSESDPNRRYVYYLYKPAN